MTTVLCPVSYAELRAGATESWVWCPRCATHHDRHFLAGRDETPCPVCRHRLAAHGPRHGLAYACPLATCTCNTKPKEKPMAETDYYREAVKSLEFAHACDIGSASATDHFQSAKVSAQLAQVDATRAQTESIRELTKAITEADTARRSTVL